MEASTTDNSGRLNFTNDLAEFKDPARVISTKTNQT
jgi:hypothetical protein